MNSTPLVSIITSTYKEASSGLLKKAIDSILKQDYSNFECIIVGDATEDAPIIEDMLLELNDLRFKFHNLDTPGGKLDVGTKPKKKGGELAKGEFLCFLDADDEFTPGRLSAMVQTFQKNPALDLVFGDAEVFLERDSGKVSTFIWRRKWNDKIKKRLHKKCNLFSSSEPMIKMSSYRKCGGIKREGYIGDWRLWQRLIESNHHQFFHIPLVLTRYRTNRLGHYIFLWYLSKKLPFNMHRSVKLGLVPGHHKLLTRVFKGKNKN